MTIVHRTVIKFVERCVIGSVDGQHPLRIGATVVSGDVDIAR